MVDSTCAVGLVADDLTGVLDAGDGFAARGHRTVVVATPPGDGRRFPSPDATVVGYNTDSRYVDAAEATRRVSAAVAARSTGTVYKKVDSTLRGNVGAEVDAALRSSGASFAALAPAYPAQGRTTRDGVHYVDGDPVDATAYAADQKGPPSAVVADLFDGLDRPVRRLSAAHLRAGVERATAELRAIVDGVESPPVVVVDATEPAHLATLADALRSFDVLVAGSGGLTKHVHVPGGVTEGPADQTPRGGAPLGVVGSVNPVTLDQLRHVPDESVFVVDPAGLVSGTARRETVSRVADRLRAGAPAVLTAAVDRDAVDRTLAEGERRGLAADAVRDRVAATLGATGVAAAEAAEPSALVLSGGDVALATLRAADGATVSLTGRSIADGMPLGRVADGTLDGTPVVTKAGGFGGPNDLTTCLERLARP